MDPMTAAAALLTAGSSRTLLPRAHAKLAALAEWDAASVEAAIREVAESKA